MGFSAHLRSLFKALGCVARAIAVRLVHRVARRAAPLATRRARRAYALRAAPAAHKRPGRHLHRPSRSASAPRGAGCRRAPARPGRIAAGARPPPGCGKRAKVRLTRGGDPRPAPAPRDAWGSGARTRPAQSVQAAHEPPPTASVPCATSRTEAQECAVTTREESLRARTAHAAVRKNAGSAGQNDPWSQNSKRLGGSRSRAGAKRGKRSLASSLNCVRARAGAQNTQVTRWVQAFR